MMNKQEKLLQAKRNVANNTRPSFSFINNEEVYKQLDMIFEKLEISDNKSLDRNKAVSKLISDIVNGLIKKIAEGITVKNISDIELSPVFKPEFKPELKAKFDVPKPTVIKEDNIFNKYKPADIIQDGNIKYYGYLAENGSWFIMREITEKQGAKYRYTNGKDNYNFTKRAKLDYKYISEIAL